MESFDLIIIGTGSGNSIIGPAYDGMKIALVERDVFGGTCLNKGCIPSKMFVYAADLAELARHGPALGVHTEFKGADWPAIRDRVFDRIDPIAAGGEEYRHSLDHVTVFSEDARFVGPKQLEVGASTITAETIVLAAGARVFVPPIHGLEDTPFHTSDTIMRIDAIPKRLVILGGGYIASELGHVFGSLGSDLTIVNRSDRLLRAEDEDISDCFTRVYQRRFDVRLNADVHSVHHDGTAFHVDTSSGGTRETLEADAVLVATGRTPNGHQLGVDQTGVELDEAGYVVADEFGRTGVDGIWALGDISNPAQLKHTANAEARCVADNIIHPDDLKSPDFRFIPHAVFGHPQVAGAGLTEQELRASGRDYVAAIRPYGDTAYGWAMEDKESICKVIADPETRRLLGAHIVGPQASILIQQLIQGMHAGQTIDDLATGQLYIHPALTEVVEQALLELVH